MSNTVNTLKDDTSEANRGVTIVPRVDILETEEEMLVVAEMPGVRSEDVDIRFENGELTLHGRRAPAHVGKQRSLWEYEVANYYRVFKLNEKIAGDKIYADLKNGVLTLHLPKTEAAKPRRITVTG